MNKRSRIVLGLIAVLTLDWSIPWGIRLYKVQQDSEWATFLEELKLEKYVPSSKPICTSRSVLGIYSYEICALETFGGSPCNDNGFVITLFGPFGFTQPIFLVGGDKYLSSQIFLVQISKNWKVCYDYGGSINE